MPVVDNIAVEKDLREYRAGRVELLQLRMGLLEEEGRLLLEMYINHHASYRQLAKLTGLSPRAVSRRVRLMIERLVSGQYMLILRHRGEFSRCEVQVAYDRYLLGLGYRAIGIKRRLGPSTVRTILRHLEARLGEFGGGRARRSPDWQEKHTVQA